MEIRHSLALLLVAVVALPGCSRKEQGAPEPSTEVESDDQSAGVPSAAPAEAAETGAATEATVPEAAAEAACTGAGSRCDGEYQGEVGPGNNPPAGANAMQCQGGKWTLKQACDATENEGCYMIEDPGSGEMNAVCVSTFAPGD